MKKFFKSLLAYILSMLREVVESKADWPADVSLITKYGEGIHLNKKYHSSLEQASKFCNFKGS